MTTGLLIRLAARWWWLLAVATTIGGTVTYGVSTTITPTYRATAVLLVVQTQTPGVIQLNDLETSARLANTFRRLMVVRPVLQEAVEQGALPMSTGRLRANVTIYNPRGMQLLEVSATADDPALARDMANLLSEAFIDSREARLTAPAGVVTVVESAIAPDRPISPHSSLNSLLGAALGLMVGGSLVVAFGQSPEGQSSEGGSTPSETPVA